MFQTDHLHALTIGRILQVSNSMTSPTCSTDSALLSAEDWGALRRITSPTIANAIETLHLRPREAGVTDAGIRCLFPEFGPMVGYACTAAIFSGQPAAEKRRVCRTDYWEYVRTSPGPRVIVVQDLSPTSGGAYWGEVNSNMHLALEAIGVITNGSVRDLEEVRATGFHFFASGVSVSHGFAHLENFNRPVRVFGMMVHPGDLIHADRHGAVVIPHGYERQVIAAAHEIERVEKVIINLCKSPDFSIAELDRLVTPEY